MHTSFSYGGSLGYSEYAAGLQKTYSFGGEGFLDQTDQPYIGKANYMNIMLSWEVTIHWYILASAFHATVIRNPRWLKRWLCSSWSQWEGESAAEGTWDSSSNTGIQENAQDRGLPAWFLMYGFRSSQIRILRLLCTHLEHAVPSKRKLPIVQSYRKV